MSSTQVVPVQAYWRIYEVLVNKIVLEKLQSCSEEIGTAFEKH